MRGFGEVAAIVMPSIQRYQLLPGKPGVVCWQPDGQAGLLVADLDLSRATGLLAKRLRTDS
jgi:hypothetical protein